MKDSQTLLKNKNKNKSLKINLLKSEIWWRFFWGISFFIYEK